MLKIPSAAASGHRGWIPAAAIFCARDLFNKRFNQAARQGGTPITYLSVGSTLATMGLGLLRRRRA